MIFGLVGERLSGKDTIANYLVQKHGAFHVRHSHILDEILDILDIPKTRRNEIDLGMNLRTSFGDEVIAKAVQKRVRDSNAQIIVMNGIRFQHELDNARQLGARIIYVTAPEDLRYKRFTERSEKVDDAKLTQEEFQALDKEPTEINIHELGLQADELIVNIDSLDNLFGKIEEIIKKYQ